MTAESNLEDKIILSMGIRLFTEKFIIEKINNKEDISKNQTRVLIEKYKDKFGNEQDNIKVLEKVNLMTPENIHFNSFMYEPIMDMGIEELKKLYSDIKTLNK